MDLMYDNRKICLDNGYPCVYYPEHHKAMANGLVYVHILQMEKILGRPLNMLEVVHHCNKIRTDYSETNLWCFRSNRDHTAFHRGADVCMSSDGIYYCPSTDIEMCCKICNKKIYYYSKYCRDCWDSYKKQKNLFKKVVRPSREVLKSLIRTKSFCEIGKLYNVSDNAIRKWCIDYNLPTHRNIIKNISDTDWEFI